jgi:hypothetical protein
MSSPQRQYCRDHAYDTYVDQDSENDWGSNQHSWRVSFPCGWRVSFPTAVHGGKPAFRAYTRDGELIEHIAFLMHFHRHGNGSTNYVCDVCGDGRGYSLEKMMSHVERYHDKAQLLSFFGYAKQSTCVVS